MAWGEQVEQPLFHFLPLGENQGLVMAWNRGKKYLIKYIIYYILVKFNWQSIINAAF